MPLARYQTAGTILNKTARKLGLIDTDLPDPVASSDTDILRLVELLNEVGQELAEQYEWRHLFVEHTIVGDGVTDTFALPDDFLDMVEQTGWNRNTDFPLAGPLSAQVWQYRKAFPVIPVYAEFRLDTNNVRFIPAIPSGQTVAFEYRSRSWVRSAAQGLGVGTDKGQTAATSGHDEVTASTDYVLFDPLLMMRGLALAYREENGFATDKEQERYQRSLDMAQGRANGGAPVLNLTRRRRRQFIGTGNVPDGSWTT